MSFEILLLYFIGFFGASIPGPDILFIMRTTLNQGRMAGFISACGVLFASLFYLSIVGLGLKNIGESPYFQFYIGLFGSIYLIWISISIWNAKAEITTNNNKDKRLLYLFLKSMIVHFSNPKVIIFFSVILAPFLHKDIIVFEIGVLTLGHMTSFFGVVYGISKLGNFFTEKRTLFINRVTALLFMLFAIELINGSYQAFMGF